MQLKSIVVTQSVYRLAATHDASVPSAYASAPYFVGVAWMKNDRTISLAKGCGFNVAFKYAASPDTTRSSLFFLTEEDAEEFVRVNNIDHVWVSEYASPFCSKYAYVNIYEFAPGRYVYVTYEAALKLISKYPGLGIKPEDIEKPQNSRLEPDDPIKRVQVAEELYNQCIEYYKNEMQKQGYTVTCEPIDKNGTNKRNLLETHVQYTSPDEVLQIRGCAESIISLTNSKRKSDINFFTRIDFPFVMIIKNTTKKPFTTDDIDALMENVLAMGHLVIGSVFDCMLQNNPIPYYPLGSHGISGPVPYYKKINGDGDIEIFSAIDVSDYKKDKHIILRNADPVDIKPSINSLLGAQQRSIKSILNYYLPTFYDYVLGSKSSWDEL